MSTSFSKEKERERYARFYLKVSSLSLSPDDVELCGFVVTLFGAVVGGFLKKAKSEERNREPPKMMMMMMMMMMLSGCCLDCCARLELCTHMRARTISLQ